MLVREQLICGTQVHVGVNDPDLAVAVAHRVAPWLPALLALSASPPFWLRDRHWLCQLPHPDLAALADHGTLGRFARPRTTTGP